ncbi:uncharacterized protein KIAA0513 [Condylostylus longicornis]|uniref:uncharacterized protein KIAA0513 n=1 Tax=Condylostylus longicornis TaxID=2530218 RepID=UPI00244DCC83|nr:uncharacterized protein KIAA0513 [Condylostylus longicornis]XP_055382104.1 uncharacterized protein KIAA0513 [Condylostylus longicornis]
MVDLPAVSSTAPAEGESSKFRKLMSSGKPAGILKSKFLTVLGNSNELLNRISNKLEETLDLSSDSDYCDDDEEEVPEDESVDMATIDFDARRVKARRAHEEIISGRYRVPNLIPRKTNNKIIPNGKNPKSSSSSDTSINNSRRSSSYSNSIDSKSSIDENLIHGENIQCLTRSLNQEDVGPGAMNLNEAPSIDVVAAEPIIPSVGDDEDLEMKFAKSAAIVNVFNQNSPVTAEEFQRTLKKTSNSSTLTSLNDPLPMSGSMESSDLKNWVRSDSLNSDPSWASSISLDGETEESCKKFMKQFVEILFTNSSTITAELKSEFGIHARTETGRLWFSRYLNAQRVKSKRVDETTFYSLVQYFAIILFECHESEDYSPAKSLMNMCFTFYHDIEVPGCEPYREYLFTYLRQQPIWHTLRFWNAAFFDALQCERAHRPVPKNSKNKRKLKNQANKKNDDEKFDKNNLKNIDDTNKEESENESSSASEHNQDAILQNEYKEDAIFQQNITFGQLGTFTCNMHAFGLSRDLSLEFLRKQATIANLSKDQIKLIRDNINRMYLETEKWGA